MPLPNESCQLFDLSENISLRNPINKSNLKYYKLLSGNLNSDTSTIIVLRASVYKISD